MSFRGAAVLALAAVSTASTCDSNVGEGDVRARETVRISQRSDGGQASGDCVNVGISTDGRFVVFESAAEDLVFPDGNGWRDIFLKDRATGELLNLTRVSPALTVGGVPRTNLLGHAFQPSVSADGRYVAFLSNGAFAGTLSIPGGPGPNQGVFVLDRQTGIFQDAIERTVYGFPNAHCTDLSMSDDGRTVVFISAATNLGYANPSNIPQVYAVDMSQPSPVVQLVSRSTASATTVANAACSSARLSRDGRTVIFLSSANNIGGPGPFNHIYAGTPAGDPVQLVSVLPGTSTPAVGTFLHPCVSGDGRYVAFIGNATLAAGSGLIRIDRGIPGQVPPSAIQFATDQWVQIFPAMFPSGVPFSMAYDGSIAYRGGGVVTQVLARSTPAASEIVSVSSAGVLGELTSEKPAISGDGRWVAFESIAPNLAEGDTNLRVDIYVHGPLR